MSIPSWGVDFFERSTWHEGVERCGRMEVSFVPSIAIITVCGITAERQQAHCTHLQETNRTILSGIRLTRMKSHGLATRQKRWDVCAKGARGERTSSRAADGSLALFALFMGSIDIVVHISLNAGSSD